MATTAAASRQAVQVARRLRSEYPDAECSLVHESPLELLVATILSAQCTDERVNIVTKDLFRTYRDAAAFAAAPLADLEQAVKSSEALLLSGRLRIGVESVVDPLCEPNNMGRAVYLERIAQPVRRLAPASVAGETGSDAKSQGGDSGPVGEPELAAPPMDVVDGDAWRIRPMRFRDHCVVHVKDEVCAVDCFACSRTRAASSACLCRLLSYGFLRASPSRNRSMFLEARSRALHCRPPKRTKATSTTCPPAFSLRCRRVPPPSRYVHAASCSRG